MGAKVPRHINLHSGSREGERFVVDSFSPFYTVQGPHKGNGATYSTQVLLDLINLILEMNHHSLPKETI